MNKEHLTLNVASYSNVLHTCAVTYVGSYMCCHTRGFRNENLYMHKNTVTVHVRAWISQRDDHGHGTWIWE